MIKRAVYPVQVFFQELRHLQLFTLYYEQHDSQNTSHLIWAQLPTSMPPGVGGTCWLLGGVLQSSFQQATISSVLPLNAPARENLQRLTFLGSSHNPSATKTSLLLQPKRKQRRVLFRAQSMSSVVKEAKWGRVREAEGNKLYCRQWRFPKAHSISFLKKRRKRENRLQNSRCWRRRCFVCVVMAQLLSTDSICKAHVVQVLPRHWKHA